MRCLGVDVGTVRTGVAVSDPDGIVATPVGTIAGGDGLAARVASVADERGCDVVVVGLPRALSGHDTPSTRMARTVADELRAAGRTVELWDERLSSAEAERLLQQAGRRGTQRRTERDPVAAAIILQSWLDATGGRRRPAE